jgi:hypothetical protein
MDNDSFDLILADTLALLKKERMTLPPVEEAPIPPSPVIVEEAPPPPPPPEPLPKPLPKVEPKPIVLEAPKPSVTSLSSIETLLRKTAPDLKIHQEVPSDEKARRVKEGYKSQQNIPDIPLLYSDPKDRPFLLNLAKAIETHYAPCHPVEMTFFEKERTWDFFLKSPHLKFILIPDMALWNSLDLMRYFKETPSTGARTLGTIPLLLIADPKLYQTDPNLKRSLWHMIKNSLKSFSTTP